MTTRKTELERFRTFLRECVENGWMAKNGAEKIIRNASSVTASIGCIA